MEENLMLKRISFDSLRYVFINRVHKKETNAKMKGGDMLCVTYCSTYTASYLPTSVPKSHKSSQNASFNLHVHDIMFQIIFSFSPNQRMKK